MTRIKIEVEAARERDVAEVMVIVAESFADPIDRDTIKGYVGNAHRRLMLAYDHHRRIVGYMAYTHGKRTLYLDSIGVCGQFRRLKIGHQLIGYLIGSLGYHKKRNIRTYVPEENLHAQLFLRECGFFTSPPYIVKKHFQDDNDAYLFEFAPAILAEEPAKNGSSAR